jgi:NTE family protein
VAASAGVPGLFPPMAVSGMYEARVQLVDGGVFDNQGISGLLDPDCLCSDFVVSDASGQSDATDRPGTDALSVLIASSGIQGDRVRQESVNSLELTQQGRTAYFHLTRGLFARDIEFNKGGVSAAPGAKMREGIVASEEEFGVSQDAQRVLAHIRTDLDSFTDVEAGCLQADGYQMAEPRLRRLHAFLAPQPSAGRWQFDRYRAVLRAPGARVKAQLDLGRHRFFKPYLYVVRGATRAGAALGLLVVSLPFVLSLVLIAALIHWALKTYADVDLWKVITDKSAFQEFVWNAAPAIYLLIVSFLLSKVAERVIRGSGALASWIQKILKGPMALISALVLRVVLPPLFAIPILLYLLVDRYYVRVMGRLD